MLNHLLNPPKAELSPQRLRRGRFVILMLLCAFAGSMAQAQENGFEPEPVMQALGDTDFAVRERMTEQLLQNQNITIEKLEQLFSRIETPEQQQRLLRIAHHHVVRLWVQRNFDEVDSGSLGITHQQAESGMIPDAYQAGIIVRSTFPGFPGHTYLQPNDLILALNGEQLLPHMDAQHFARMIRVSRAGREIMLDVYRDGQVRNIALALAPGTALTTTYDGPNFTLSQAPAEHWHAKRQQLLDHIPQDE